MIIQTQKFKLPSSVIVNNKARHILSRWWWLFLLPVLACAVMSYYDWRWIFVGAAVILILYPLVLMMAYFNHALTTDAVRSTLEQTVLFDKHGISITYFGKDVAPELLIPRRIAPNEIASWEDTGKYLTIKTTDGSEIFIPISAISDPVGVTYLLRSI